jgi:hypothetical protein
MGQTLGHKLINITAEATKWQTYRSKIPAGHSGFMFKGILLRDGSHFVVLWI